MLLIVAGVVVAGIGWGLLLEGGKVGGIPNAHILAVANNIILLGYVLAMAGLLIWLLRKPRTEPVSAPPLQPSSVPEAPEPEADQLRFSPQQCQKLESKFKDTFKKDVTVHPDGSAQVTNRFTSQQFPSVEEAWTYCQTRALQQPT